MKIPPIEFAISDKLLAVTGLDDSPTRVEDEFGVTRVKSARRGSNKFAGTAEQVRAIVSFLESSPPALGRAYGYEGSPQDVTAVRSTIRVLRDRANWGY